MQQDKKKKLMDNLIDKFSEMMANIIVDALIGALLSFLCVICWTRLAANFHLPMLNFDDFICIYCVIKIIQKKGK